MPCTLCQVQHYILMYYIIYRTRYYIVGSFFQWRHSGAPKSTLRAGNPQSSGSEHQLSNPNICCTCGHICIYIYTHAEDTYIHIYIDIYIIYVYQFVYFFKDKGALKFRQTGAARKFGGLCRVPISNAAWYMRIHTHVYIRLAPLIRTSVRRSVHVCMCLRSCRCLEPLAYPPWSSSFNLQDQVNQLGYGAGPFLSLFLLAPRRSNRGRRFFGARWQSAGLG